MNRLTPQCIAQKNDAMKISFSFSVNFMLPHKSGFVYDFNAALGNTPEEKARGIIRPSATPAVFELRNPNQDIYGRVL